MEGFYYNLHPMSNVITLLSDWRLRDPYVAMLKGEILSSLPDATVLDISHYVDKFNILQEALLMKTCYKSFPDESIHILLVNTSLNSDSEPIVIRHDNHYFVGEDNGIFYMMFGNEMALQGRKIPNSSGNVISDILSIIHNINNNSLIDNTIEYSSFRRMFIENVEYSDSAKQIVGKIIYIDAFNNAVTNISAEMFAKLVGENPFTAIIQSKGEWTIDSYSESYQDFANEMYLTANSLGLIEITSYQSDVAVLADLELGDVITINY